MAGSMVTRAFRPKRPLPIVVTVAGRATVVCALLSNTRVPSVVSCDPAPKFTGVKLLLLKKAELPIEIKLSGKVIDVRPEL